MNCVSTVLRVTVLPCLPRPPSSSRPMPCPVSTPEGSWGDCDMIQCEMYTPITTKKDIRHVRWICFTVIHSRLTGYCFVFCCSVCVFSFDGFRCGTLSVPITVVRTWPFSGRQALWIRHRGCVINVLKVEALWWQVTLLRKKVNNFNYRCVVIPGISNIKEGKEKYIFRKVILHTLNVHGICMIRWRPGFWTTKLMGIITRSMDL